MFLSLPKNEQIGPSHVGLKMVEIEGALRELPSFDSFCTVGKINELVDRLKTDARFAVGVVGLSAGGLPIHHVAFGGGAVKAMFVGFPHAMEPVGGLTAFGLLSLLQVNNQALVGANVEWHIVPCIDPDGALLNEAWTQNFTVDNYLRNYYMQTHREQAAMSFPITHKNLVWNAPSCEAKTLLKLLEEVRPDFYFSLHNTRAGGMFCGLSHDIDRKYHSEIHAFLEREYFPVQKRAPYKEICEQYADGIAELIFMDKLYDYLERVMPRPEESAILRYGANDWDYLAQIKPSALSVIAEPGCLAHPFDASEMPTAFNLRRLRLQIDADAKFLASVLLDEWQKVKGDLDSGHPLYRAVAGYVLPPFSKVAEGGWPLSRYPTAEIISDSRNDRPATEGEVFNVCVMDSGLYFVQFAYQFVRLLAESPKTTAVQKSIKRAEEALDEVKAAIGQYIDLNALTPVDFNILVRVQLGCGLICLNSVIEKYG